MMIIIVICDFRLYNLLLATSKNLHDFWKRHFNRSTNLYSSQQ